MQLWEFRLLLNDWQEVQNVEYTRTGVVAAEIRNSNRTKASDKVWTPFDFFPHLKEAQHDQFVTPEEAHAAFAARARIVKP